MYTKDKSNRITLRLNDQQFDFVKSSADVLGVSPSDFLRMVVNLAMASSDLTKEKVDDLNEEEIATLFERGLRRENEKTDNDDQL